MNGSRRIILPQPRAHTSFFAMSSTKARILNDFKNGDHHSCQWDRFFQTAPRKHMIRGEMAVDVFFLGDLFGLDFRFWKVKWGIY